MIDDDGGDGPRSLWLDTTPPTAYPPLDGDLRVEIAVVGGGLSALSAATEFVERGDEVCVIEAGRIGAATTGHTTAKLTSQHGLIYAYLTSTFGRDRAQQYADANERAIDAVERRVDGFDDDVGFERTPAIVYTTDPERVAEIEEEARVASRLGLPASFTDEIEPLDVAGAVRFDEQAQFHPRKYLLAIADEIEAEGGQIVEQTRATALRTGPPHRVETDHGHVVADCVVVASHFPFTDRGGYFARLHPRRAYLLAVRTVDAPPRGMFYGADDPSTTFRPYDDGDRSLLLVGGQGHEPGAPGPPASERYRRCRAFAMDHFSVEEERYRWSTHDYTTVDRVPCIGPIGPFTDDVYVATGYGGWGLAAGVAAGRILAGLYHDGGHPHAAVFDPRRLTPRASTKHLLEENLAVLGRFFGDRVRSWTGGDDLPARGEGRVVRRRGRPVAVHRDDDGALHAVSAVCPHLWCIVGWNDAERTWDCPCHGSRFEADGTVKTGPAVDDLPRREL